jgi:hypothetical protein
VALVPDGVDPNRHRIYAIIARTAQCAVAFRRGPSRRVRLMLWHLASETIEACPGPRTSHSQNSDPAG